MNTQKSPIGPALDYARDLRQSMTDAEKLIWSKLRDRRFENLKFRRQHPIPPYITDFYCEDLKLVIELDGGQHSDQADEKRTKYLESRGLRIIRFWNHDVLSNIEGVMMKILEYVGPDIEKASPHPYPLPEGEGVRIEIPDHFLNVQYNGECYPGAAGLQGFENGANCQHFAYELLRHFGCVIPDFRSSDLWEDEEHTYAVTALEPLDLVMLNKDDDCWGAHVGVYVGQDVVLHLSKKIGIPAFETMQQLMNKPEYKIFIGAKRCRVRG